MGDRVYKAKKPVSLGFLDLRTVAARRATLSAELQLNRRMSPDCYLGLADFVAPDGRREPVLCMRRLPADRRLSTLIRKGACTEDDVLRIARRLAAFHESCDVVPDGSTIGSVAHLRSLWQDAFDVVGRRGDLFPVGQIVKVRALATEYLDGRSLLLDSRRLAGRIRDGHGDLLADDIFLLPDGARILDCLEFDPSLRCGDTLLDACFLAMDIERYGNPALARAFLDGYRASSADEAPASLAHHYIAYRALVRAKVAVLRIEQGDAGAADDARTLVELALHHLEAGQVRLTVVSGLPGTGKSTLAKLLRSRWRDTRTCQLLQSDVVRDQSDGVDPGRYDPTARAAVYRTMFFRAERALQSGTDVILDATFGDSWTRAAVAALADSCDARLLALRCEAPTAVVLHRLAKRVRGADTRSEADVTVYRQLADDMTTWTAAHRVDTSVGIDKAYEQVARLSR